MDDLKQMEVEDSLRECQLIEVKPVKNSNIKFYYSLDEELLLKFLQTQSNEDAKKLLTKSAQKKSLILVPRTEIPSKRSTYINSLKKSIEESDVILKDLYFDWIDAVYANPKGFLSQSGIKEMRKTLSDFTSDKKVEKEIIKIAIKNGYRNLDWAINEYQNSKTNFLYIVG